MMEVEYWIRGAGKQILEHWAGAVVTANVDAWESC